MARKKLKPGAAEKDRLIANQALALAEYAAKVLVVAEQLHIKTKLVEGLLLPEGERAILSVLPALPTKLKKKLARTDSEFTLAEVASMTLAVAEVFVEADTERQLVLLLIATKLMACLQQNLVVPEEVEQTRRSKSTDQVYQFKITLLDSKPPIWRRIQVKDGTLDKLHEHIQTAMGWTNSHLHHFRIGKQLYGDPELMAENFEDMGYKDSTTTKISDILPSSGKKFRFQYEYDFGDSWHHEILFEGVVRAERGQRYPVCLEGERACPPEDVGGVWGYADFVKIIQNPEHKDHDGMLGWAGGSFDPEAFDLAIATKEMRKGLPDWRKML